MCGKGHRAQTSHGTGIDDHTGTHDQLFDHGRDAHIENGEHGLFLRLEPAGEIMDGQVNIIPVAHHRSKGQNHSHRLADDSGQRRTGHFHTGETEIAVDQQIVEDHIDHIGRQIVHHGGAAVAGAPQGCGDGTGEGHGDDAQCLDLQIDGTVGQSGCLGSAHELHQGFCKQEHQHAADQRQHQSQQQGLTQDQVGFVLLGSAFVPGHQGSSAHIHGLEHGHHQKFGLRGQPYAGDSGSSQFAHHHQVHHGGQLSQCQLDEGGPGDAYHIPVHHLGSDPFRQLFGGLSGGHHVFVPAWFHKIQGQRRLGRRFRFHKYRRAVRDCHHSPFSAFLCK